MTTEDSDSQAPGEHKATNLLARQDSEEAGAVQQGVGFTLAGQYYLALGADIRSILPLPSHIARIPGATGWCPGVTAVAGEFLLTVDLRLFFGLPEQPKRQGITQAFVVERPGLNSALMVDHITGPVLFSRITDNPGISLSAVVAVRPFIRGRVDSTHQYTVLDLGQLAQTPIFAPSVPSRGAGGNAIGFAGKAGAESR